MGVQAGWGRLTWGRLGWWEWLEGERGPTTQALSLLGLAGQLVLPRRRAKGQESEQKHAQSQKDRTQDSHTVTVATFHGPAQSPRTAIPSELPSPLATAMATERA